MTAAPTSGGGGHFARRCRPDRFPLRVELGAGPVPMRPWRACGAALVLARNADGSGLPAGDFLYLCLDYFFFVRPFF